MLVRRMRRGLELQRQPHRRGRRSHSFLSLFMALNHFFCLRCDVVVARLVVHAAALQMQQQVQQDLPNQSKDPCFCISPVLVSLRRVASCPTPQTCPPTPKRRQGKQTTTFLKLPIHHHATTMALTKLPLVALAALLLLTLSALPTLCKSVPGCVEDISPIKF